MAKNTSPDEKTVTEEIGKKSKKCGVIMPIADHKDYKTGHWADVLAILIEALDDTEFEINIVSDDAAIGLIHERIVNNIYSNEIVICDVSSKNPNVMFELGMRLAFDKPTIIIKDEKTGYSFDTGVIEHLSYPSDLRFGDIKSFKEHLKKKVIATYEKSKEPDFSPFLKSFGKHIAPGSINQIDVPATNFILEQIESLRKDIRTVKNYPSSLNPFQISTTLKTSTSNVKLTELIDNYLFTKFPFTDLRNEDEVSKLTVSLKSIKNYVNSNGYKLSDDRLISFLVDNYQLNVID